MSKKNIHLDDETSWRALQLADLQERYGSRQKSSPKPLTPGQSVYFQAIEQSRVILCSGPAGTGKTFLPTALGACWLRDSKISRIILTRPLVTCSTPGSGGVGFLPGDLMEKISPYMRPMLDVLRAFYDPQELEKHIRLGSLELVPLDLMRGMSIEGTLVIADEMQNATPEQLRMLLTRIGKGTTIVVSGDATQTDLPFPGGNPLAEAMRRLGGEKGISIVRLTQADQCRDPLVNAIDSRLTTKENFSERYLRIGHDDWYCVKCCNCGLDNWYSNGNEQDPNAPDVEQVLCWSCDLYLQIPEMADQEPSAAQQNPSDGHCTAGTKRHPKT